LHFEALAFRDVGERGHGELDRASVAEDRTAAHVDRNPGAVGLEYLHSVDGTALASQRPHDGEVLERIELVGIREVQVVDFGKHLDARIGTMPWPRRSATALA
jgi:hypothetical protein